MLTGSGFNPVAVIYNVVPPASEPSLSELLMEVPTDKTSAKLLEMLFGNSFYSVSGKRKMKNKVKWLGGRPPTPFLNDCAISRKKKKIHTL